MRVGKRLPSAWWCVSPAQARVAFAVTTGRSMAATAGTYQWALWHRAEFVANPRFEGFLILNRMRIVG